MASSVHRARLDREAKLDPLTGVPVRRVLESRLQRAYRHACEEGKPMAVIMCDIDFFKKVNDNHGHAAGDEALKLVASTLDSERRERDLCCRYGGEEFTLLLEETDGDAALRLAERLRRAVQGLHFVFEERHIPLTLSLGVAGFPELHIKTASELLLLADEALYEAKGRGRNQCLLNIGREAYRAPEAVGRQESSTIIDRPRL
jgi:diguanylate cyclase (GGDEF)-like protein